MSCGVLLCCGLSFFFKQKTAYEMRSSDWSSDVCSSDLPAPHQPDRMGCKLDAQNFAESRKIVVNSVPPIVIEVPFAIPFAGAFPGGVGEFIEGEDGG